MVKSDIKFILVALVLILIAIQPVTARAQSDSPIPNLEVILVIDESQSMLVADSQDRRRKAVELFINTLGVDLSGADFRLALIAFNDDAWVIGDGFVSLKTAQDRQQLLADYEAQRGQALGGYTNVLDGLKKARSLLNGHQTDYKPIVVVISDGQPETEEANANFPDAWKAYTEEIKSYAADAFDDVSYEGKQCPSAVAGTSIYTIAIGTPTSGETSELKDFWVTLASLSGGGGYREYAGGNEAQFQKNLQTIFVEFLREWLCVQVESEVLITPTGKNFAVNASHQQIIISIAKTDPNVQVKIFDATGQQILETFNNVNRNQSSLIESWAISRPPDGQGWSGNWRVELTGAGQVEVNYISVSDIQLSFISPPAEIEILPLGADLVIQASVLNHNGPPVNANAILSPQVTVIGPDNQPLPNTEVSVLSNGTMISIVPAPEKKGRYEIEVKATVAAADGQYPVAQKKIVELSNLLPWLKVTSPKIGFNYPLGTLSNLEAILMLHTKEFDGVINRDQVSATLYQTNSAIREQIGLYDLSLMPEKGKGHFGAPLSNQLAPGQYLLTAQLISQPLGGQEYEAPIVSVPFTIQAPDPVTPIPTATSIPVATNTAISSSPPPPPPSPPPPTATATPIPQCSSPPCPLVPPYCLIAIGALFFLLILGIIIYLFLHNRPNLDGMGLEDISAYPNLANEVIFGPITYFGKTITIRDADDYELAQLRFMPEAREPRVEVVSLAEDVEVRYDGIDYGEGDEFRPVDQAIIEISDQNKIMRLRFSGLEFNDEDEDDEDEDEEDEEDDDYN